jgi:hypothetical protein
VVEIDEFGGRVLVAMKVEVEMETEKVGMSTKDYNG